MNDSGARSATSDAAASALFRAFDFEAAVGRYFLYLLSAIVLAALLPMLIVAVTRPISLDGFWNVFMDTQDRWALFFAEYHRDQHPLLYRFVLRAVARLGSSRLIYRSASIIPGLGTIYVLGLVAARLCRSQTVALLAAVAYGFSATIIDLNCDVRAYPLALLFLVLSFLGFVDFLRGSSDQSRKRALIWFAWLSTAAVGTEAYAALYVISCFGLLVLMSLRYSAFRRDLLRLTADGKTVALAFGLPVAAALAYYVSEARHRIIPRVYLLQFYWVHGESVAGFILKNLRLELSYLAPIELSIGVTIAMLLIAVAWAAIYFGGAKERTCDAAAAAAPALIATLVIVQLILLALARHYPFGGEARHQSVVFPFIMLSAFIALDRILAPGPIEKYRSGLLAALALVLAVNRYHQWNQPADYEEPYSREFATFQASFPAARCVYTDQFSLLAYYAHTVAWKWTFADHLQEAGEAVEEYLITSPSGVQVELLRNLGRWNFDPGKPEFYPPVREMLRGRDSITLFFVKQFADQPGNSKTEPIEKTIRTMAADAKLRVNSILSDDAATFVTFSAG